MKKTIFILFMFLFGFIIGISINTIDSNIKIKETPNLICGVAPAFGCIKITNTVFGNTFLIEYLPEYQRCKICPTISNTIEHELDHINNFKNTGELKHE